ncbi:MAG: DUF697 domain-containing protein [Cyanobacteria bacterium K_DeepCast_35m_m1_288]|nr:DUF697 domain-containing protein [Cyanobacteria bacterium K_DeepCast_35m_m1_288]
MLPQIRRFWPLAAGLGGGVILLESSHGALSSVISLSAAAAGFWLLSGRLRPSGRALPTSVEGWLERCQSVLESFERLEPDGDPLLQQQRREQLEQLRQSLGSAHLQVALVGQAGWSEALQAQLLQHCPSPLPLRVLRSQPLPPSSAAWYWPDAFRRCDLIVYRLSLPLSATDLRWLEALPKGQDVLLLADRPPGDWPLALQQLQHQLPESLRQHCWPWSPEVSEAYAADLQPLALAFAALSPERLRFTQQRCLEELHGSWQVALESLRRRQWQQLMQRTQWAVAAGVVVAPLPSLDLLVLAAANGLMLQEMARLWDCPWSLEQLQAAALHLAKACLALGVVEWSAQSLAALVKLHGATWLVGGALQALNAAYLTRVVGRAMADYMALAAGVPEAELERLLQQQAPVLVARAAEEEKLDWAGFLQQAQQWVQQWVQQSGAAGTLKASAAA